MLDHDVEVQPSDVSGITGREEVRAFFAQLGYPTQAGRQTSPEAENMSVRLQEAVRHIELVARDALALRPLPH